MITATKDHPEIYEVFLHVQISNADAIAFYTKQGFEKGEMLENYYKRIEPPHCYVVRLPLADKK